MAWQHGSANAGYSVALLDTEIEPCYEGEIYLDLSARPLGLMQGVNGYYHTGDG